MLSIFVFRDKASFREIARGQISGDSIGTLKKLFHRETRELLGVRIVGESPSELLHIGQAMASLGGRINYFVNTVFDYLKDLLLEATYPSQNSPEQRSRTQH